MQGIDFIYYMLNLSFRKLLRNKYSLLAEIIEFTTAFVIFFGLYQLRFFDELSFIYLLTTLLIVGAMGTGTKLGITLINHKSQGFMQEFYSAPIPTNIKIFGLMAESFSLMLVRTTILLIVAFVLGISLSIVQLFAIYVIIIASAAITSFISIIISSKTNNIQLLAIAMSIISFMQFGLNGLILKAQDIPIIIANPYSYIADLLLYASNQPPNYPLAIDTTIILISISLTYLASITIIEKTEI